MFQIPLPLAGPAVLGAYDVIAQIHVSKTSKALLPCVSQAVAAERVCLQSEQGKTVPRAALLDHVGVRPSSALPRCVAAPSPLVDQDPLPLPSRLACSSWSEEPEVTRGQSQLEV